MVTTLPNLLTLSRIVAVPALVAAFYLGEPLGNWVAFVLFVAAAVTDVLDGHLARSRGQVSALGRFLDPVADKLLVASVLLMLVYARRVDGLAVLPAVVILAREILVSGLREYLAEIKVGLPVTRLAKWKTAVQMVALALLVAGDAAVPALPLEWLGTVGLWIAALLTMYTGYDYLRVGLSHMVEDRRTGTADGPEGRRGAVPPPQRLRTQPEG